MADHDTSTKDLIRELAEQTSGLVRKELALAQAEMKDKGRRAGVGGGLLGAAGVVALLAVGTLIACAVLALATAVDAWLAALIVAVALGAAAGIGAMIGKQRLQSATPVAPEQAVASVHADVREIRDHAKRA